jgi:hypothetical protein
MNKREVIDLLREVNWFGFDVRKITLWLDKDRHFLIDSNISLHRKEFGPLTPIKGNDLIKIIGIGPKLYHLIDEASERTVAKLDSETSMKLDEFLKSSDST